MPVFGSACRSQTGDTTSTECLAWSSRAWRPAESGTLAPPSAGKEKPSGLFSTSWMLKKKMKSPKVYERHLLCVSVQSANPKEMRLKPWLLVRKYVCVGIGSL